MSHLDAHLLFMRDHNPEEVVALLIRSVPVDLLRAALTKASGGTVPDTLSEHVPPPPTRLDSR